MKKFAILALAVAMVVVFTLPAAAVENTFGGLFRTWFVSQRDFSGTDAGANDEAQDWQGIVQRTRIKYDAKINDNLELHNQFEIDAEWGSPGTFNGNSAEGGFGANADGDYGTDGVGVEVKHSYMVFKMLDGKLETRMGLQPAKLARGFMADDDVAGVTVLWFGPGGIIVPVVYAKMQEGGLGNDANDEDIDVYVVAPVWSNDMITVQPYWVSAQSEDFTGVAGSFEKVYQHFVGVDFDLKTDVASLWFTGIYMFGNMKFQAEETDFDGYLLAIGGKVNAGPAEIHGQTFYITGNDKDRTAGEDYENFLVATGDSYIWAEIMGKGVFDNQVSNNSPGDNGANAFGLWASNLGVTVKPMDKLSFTLDVWFAKLAEEQDFNGDGDSEDKLGTEVDARITYELVEGLNVDLIGAYLWAGDATTSDSTDEANPYELGAQFILTF